MLPVSYKPQQDIHAAQGGHKVHRVVFQPLADGRQEQGQEGGKDDPKLPGQVPGSVRLLLLLGRSCPGVSRREGFIPMITTIQFISVFCSAKILLVSHAGTLAQAPHSLCGICGKCGVCGKCAKKS